MPNNYQRSYQERQRLKDESKRNKQVVIIAENSHENDECETDCENHENQNFQTFFRFDALLQQNIFKGDVASFSAGNWGL